MNTEMHCFIFFAVHFGVQNDILVKTCNKNLHFSVILQFGFARCIMRVDVPDLVHNTIFGTVPDPVICPDC